MSTSPSYAASPWLPLSPTARGWEAKVGAPTGAAIRAVRHHGGGIGLHDDPMAREAGAKGQEIEPPAESPVRNSLDVPPEEVTPGPREGAPRIADVHAWGVEDRWGPKAGRWGRGAKVFKDGSRK